MNRTYLPTRKWFVSTATTLAGLFTMWATTGTWDQEETVGLITLGLAAFTSYMIPNNPDNVNSP